MTIGTRIRRGLVLGVAGLLAAAGTVAVVAAAPTTAGAAACTALPASLPAAGALPVVGELPDPFRHRHPLDAGPHLHQPLTFLKGDTS